MQQLFNLLFRLRFLIVFLVLEGICALLIIRNNNYQRASFLSSSNVIVGTIRNWQHGVSSYFGLKDVNAQLVEENGRLRQLLHNEVDSLSMVSLDSSLSKQFEFVPAQVIRNSIHLKDNFITINKGSKDGIKVGMAVVSADGIVGDVKVCSEHYATLFSFLHGKTNVASKVKRTQTPCSSKWKGKDFRVGNIEHINVQNKRNIEVGDTIMTSVENATYPPNIPIGIVKEIESMGTSNNYNIQMDLTTKFSNLNYVYVVKDKAKASIDSLEQILLDKNK